MLGSQIATFMWESCNFSTVGGGVGELSCVGGTNL